MAEIRWNINICKGNKADELRILVFKGDPHTVDGERVLLILVSVVMSGNVSLHSGDVGYILHTKKEKKKRGRQKITQQKYKRKKEISSDFKEQFTQSFLVFIFQTEPKVQ